MIKTLFIQYIFFVDMNLLKEAFAFQKLLRLLLVSLVLTHVSTLYRDLAFYFLLLDR